MPDPMGLTETMREVGETIASALPDGVGFTLLVFDFGKGGSMSYMSNAVRDDMIASLEELLGRLRKDRH